MVSWWGSWELGPWEGEDPSRGQEHFFIFRNFLFGADSSVRHWMHQSADGFASWYQNLKGFQPAT